MAEPRLRFKKDDGSEYESWIEKPLGTLVSDNQDPVPTPREGYRRVGIYCHAKGTFQEDVPAEKVLDVDTMYRIHQDNLIVNITFAWEHAVAIVKPEDEGLLVSHRFPEYAFNPGQVPNFYKYLILRPYFRNQLSLASPGGAGRNRVLNKAQFKRIPISIPCHEEQQKIADFLSTVDEVISTSEAEVTNLEKQKKAVMKKIFSQEVQFKRADGSDFPEWDELRINEAVVINPRTPAIPDEFYYMDLGSVDHGQWLDMNIVVKDDAPSRAQRVADIGDVFFQSVRPYNMGHYCLNALLDKTVVASTGFLQLRCNDLLLNKFLFQLLFEENFNKEVDLRCTGQAYPSINTESFSEIMIGIPCLEEQRLIADFLSDFDEAIAAAKKELELWKELKKGLLQQMFV